MDASPFAPMPRWHLEGWSEDQIFQRIIKANQEGDWIVRDLLIALYRPIDDGQAVAPLRVTRLACY
jgi:hypothetical protein